MDCQVCGEKFNRTNKQINCDNCDYSICLSCYSRYLFSTHKAAHCVSCKIEWPRTELSKKAGDKFMKNDYKKYYQEIIYEREKTFFPETQIKISRLQKQKQILDLKNKYKKDLETLYAELDQIRYDFIQEEDKKYVIKKCTTEDCKGFLDSKDFCSLCNNFICKNCMEPKDEMHICDLDKAETIRILKKETRSCPKCFILIDKIQGTCSQMFCTNCNTVFDWQTGLEIKNGFMHNPHYMDWRKTQKIDENKIISSLNMLDYLMFLVEKKIIAKEIAELCRSIFHLNDEKNHFYNQGDNFDLRFKLLNKEIDEDTFKSLIYKRDKKKEKDFCIYQTLDNFCDKMFDKFLSFCQSLKFGIDNNYMDNLENHIISLLYFLEMERIEINKKLYSIGASFRSKKYSVNEELKLI